MILNIFLSIILGASVSLSLTLPISKLLDISNTNFSIFAFLLTVFFGLTIYFVLSKYTVSKFLGYPWKARGLLLISSLLLGIWLVFAIPAPLSGQIGGRLFFFTCYALALAFGIFMLSTWLFARTVYPIRQIPISPWLWLLYVLATSFVWTLYLLAFWPGIMSFDSNFQWEQMVAFKFNDWHPAFHTLTNWLITRIWLSPAAVAFAQIFAMSFVLGWGFVEQRRLGAPRWLPWVSIISIALIPANGMMVITLWKDVFFSISLLAFTILIFKIVMSDGEWIQLRTVNWIYLGFTAALVSLFRQNGPPVAFGTMLCLILAYRRSIQPFLLAFVFALGVWAGIRGPVYNVLKVDKTSAMARVPGFGMAFAHLIARYTHTDTAFSADERALLLKIRPEKQWPYECELETDLFFTKLDWANLRDYTLDLGLLSAKLIFRNPEVFVGHIICNSAFLYQITQPADRLYEPIETGVYPNKFGIVRDSKFPAFTEFVSKWLDQSNPLYNWIFWRIPFWLYLLLGSVTSYAIRFKNPRALLLVLPVLFNMLPLALMTVLQSFRYVYSALVVSVLMSGFFMYLNLQRDSNDSQSFAR
jgi:hypothetical protein